MKIKIIILLAKIANGEAPSKIKYENNIYEYCQNDNRYHQITKNYPNRDMNDLSKVFGIMNFNYLNDEVEIIEDKKIEKISWNEKQEILARRTEKLKASLNELIDEINKLKED